MNQSEANVTSYPDFSFYFNGLSGLYSCNFLFGLPANIYVVYQISGGGGGAVAAEFFALNLAVGEVLFCVFCLYTLLHFLLKTADMIGYLLVYILMQLMFTSRPIFQGWICLERYLAVVHPTVFLRLKPLRFRLLCCAVSWMLILLDALINVFNLGPLHAAYLFILKSLFFLVLMLYCSAHVLCVLRKPRPGEGGRERENQNSMKRKAFKVIMITLTVSIGTLCLNLFILGPTLVYGSDQVVTRVLLISLLVNIISGFIPPLLYLHRAGKLPCIRL